MFLLVHFVVNALSRNHEMHEKERTKKNSSSCPLRLLFVFFVAKLFPARATIRKPKKRSRYETLSDTFNSFTNLCVAGFRPGGRRDGSRHLGEVQDRPSRAVCRFPKDAYPHRFSGYVQRLPKALVFFVLRRDRLRSDGGR